MFLTQKHVVRRSGWQYCRINEKKEKKRTVPLYHLKMSRNIEVAACLIVLGFEIE